MPSGPPLTPAIILATLLSTHPEAHSLLSEANHWRALAEQSALYADQCFTDAQADRFHFEEVGHRLDPRFRRLVQFPLGLLLVAIGGVLLAITNRLQLNGVLPAGGALFTALAASAVWLVGAWSAALWHRERRPGLIVTAVTAGAALSLLMGTLHCNAGLAAGQSAWRAAGVALFLAVIINSLVVGATFVTLRLEPGAVCVARRKWERSSGRHTAARLEQRADEEAATVAREGWLSLVRKESSAIVKAEGWVRIIEETMALALAMGGAVHLSLPSS